MTLLEHYEMERKEGLEEGLKKGILGLLRLWLKMAELNRK